MEQKKKRRWNRDGKRIKKRKDVKEKGWKRKTGDNYSGRLLLTGEMVALDRD